VNKLSFIVLGLGLAASVPAFAGDGHAHHGHKRGYTHCIKDGVGIKTKGKSEAKREASCKELGGTWDESKELKIGEKVKTATPVQPEAGADMEKKGD